LERQVVQKGGGSETACETVRLGAGRPTSDQQRTGQLNSVSAAEVSSVPEFLMGIDPSSQLDEEPRSQHPGPSVVVVSQALGLGSRKDAALRGADPQQVLRHAAECLLSDGSLRLPSTVLWIADLGGPKLWKT
jgi:hypothetical protein